jgi:hypothetical protein
MRSINLYASLPHSPAARALADLLRVDTCQPVYLRPLSELPAPDKQHLMRQRLRNERIGLRAQLDSVCYLITLGEQRPYHYGEELTVLRADRDRYQTRLLTIGRELGEPEIGVEL